MNMEGDASEERVLGLWWTTPDDNFTFCTNFQKIPDEIALGDKRPTKRQILQLVMSVFDPLGFVAHHVVKAKILLQEIWRSEVGWDDEVSDLQDEKWKRWIYELHGINDVKIPRCY